MINMIVAQGVGITCRMFNMDLDMDNIIEGLIILIWIHSLVIFHELVAEIWENNLGP